MNNISTLFNSDLMPQLSQSLGHGLHDVLHPADLRIITRRHVYYPHCLAKSANNVLIGNANWSRAARGMGLEA
jgi:hypothetical protein